MINKHNGIDIPLDELIKLRFAAGSINLASHKLVNTQRAGGHLSTLRGRGIDFDEVRSYQPGDDIRNMDWRVTARTGSPHIKLYHEERERPVFLLIDYGPSMFFGTRVAFKSVIAAQAAALLGWAAIQNGDRLGALVFSGDDHIEFKPRSRQHGILPLLKSLSDQNECRQNKIHDAALSEALMRLRYVTKPGSLIFIISDFSTLEENAERHLSRLRQHNEIIACHVVDPIEKNAPPPNTYAITNGIQSSIMDTRSKIFIREYEKQYSHQQDYLNSVLRKRQIPLIELATNDSIIDVLRECFGN